MKEKIYLLFYILLYLTMMINDYVFNINKIREYLEQETKNDPERTHSSLDLLVKNVQNEVFDGITNNWYIAVSIDKSNEIVTVFGVPIPYDSDQKLQVLWYARDYDIQKQIYCLFNNCISAAEKLNFSDDLFKIIKRDGTIDHAKDDIQN